MILCIDFGILYNSLNMLISADIPALKIRKEKGGIFMRELLLNICPFAFWYIVVCEIITGALLFALWKRKKAGIHLRMYIPEMHMAKCTGKTAEKAIYKDWVEE